MSMRRIDLAAALFFFPALAYASPALVSATPSADSVAQGSPSAVELSFSEPIQPANSRIKVKSPEGKAADGADTHIVGDNKHLAVTLKAILPGRYMVDWHVSGATTGAAQGRYSFTIAP